MNRYEVKLARPNVLDPTLHAEQTRNEAIAAAARCRHSDNGLASQSTLIAPRRFAASQAVSKGFGRLTHLMPVYGRDKRQGIGLKHSLMQSLKIVLYLAPVVSPADSPTIVAGIAHADLQVVEPNFLRLTACLPHSFDGGCSASSSQAVYIGTRTNDDDLHSGLPPLARAAIMLKV
jgi:hypothetical protein